jgi:hypothetical protein
MALQDTARAAPAIAGSDPLETSLRGSFDGSEIATNSGATQGSESNGRRKCGDQHCIGSDGSQRNPRAVRDARLVLIREAIFENLGGVRLFVETAQLLIEARDDTGMAHAVRMGAHHYRAAIQLVKDISALKAEGIQ